MPRLILRSPIHRLMSGKYAIISFHGRRSGRIYGTPIAYVADGDGLVVSTDSSWWRNLEGGQPVMLRLQGHDEKAIAVPIHDPQRSRQILRHLVEAIPSYAKFAGVVRTNGRVSDDEINRALKAGRVAIEVLPQLTTDGRR